VINNRFLWPGLLWLLSPSPVSLVFKFRYFPPDHCEYSKNVPLSYGRIKLPQLLQDKFHDELRSRARVFPLRCRRDNREKKRFTKEKGKQIPFNIGNGSLLRRIFFRFRENIFVAHFSLCAYSECFKAQQEEAAALAAGYQLSLILLQDGKTLGRSQGS
jgi:hypothetical protein